MRRDLYIVTFTERGTTLGEKLKNQLEEANCCGSVWLGSRKKTNDQDAPSMENVNACDCVHLGTKKPMRENSCDNTASNDTDVSYIAELSSWIEERFLQQDTILFIGAAGIAVRYVAPFVKDKFTDSAVLVMDEKGQFVIPLLSGHIGEANRWAKVIGELINAIPVITTATDVEGELPIDVFATNHDLAIANREGIAKVASKQLEKKSLTLRVAKEYEGQVDIAIGEDKEALLTLIPREYVLGIGCRKDINFTQLSQMVESELARLQIKKEQILCIATIDLKAKEKALLFLAKEYKCQLKTFTAAQLEKVPGEFSASEFVKEQVGVDNVCERAALAACAGNGELIQKKIAKDGMTLAVAKRDWRITLYELPIA